MAKAKKTAPSVGDAVVYTDVDGNDYNAIVVRVETDTAVSVVFVESSGRIEERTGIHHKDHPPTLDGPRDKAALAWAEDPRLPVPPSVREFEHARRNVGARGTWQPSA